MKYKQRYGPNLLKKDIKQELRKIHYKVERGKYSETPDKILHSSFFSLNRNILHSFRNHRLSFFFFFRFYFFPFSPQSPPVRSFIFFVAGPSSCGTWDAASAWFGEQCHVCAQDSKQRNTGPPAAERANLTTRPRGQPQLSFFLIIGENKI